MAVWKTTVVCEHLNTDQSNWLSALPVAVSAIPANSAARANHAKSAKHIVDYLSHVFFSNMHTFPLTQRGGCVWKPFVQRNGVTFSKKFTFNFFTAAPARSSRLAVLDWQTAPFWYFAIVTPALHALAAPEIRYLQCFRYKTTRCLIFKKSLLCIKFWEGRTHCQLFLLMQI